MADPAKLMVLRCYAWAALRFSDHRGLDPNDCGLNENSLRGKTDPDENHWERLESPKSGTAREQKLLGN